MKALKLFGLSIALLAGSYSFSAASTAGKALDGPLWEKLGMKVVDMRADHDEIVVGAYDGLFTKVKLKIMKAPIHLLNINIIFGNGTNENVVFNRKFAAGSETRVIDLTGGKRIIKRVKLNYKSVPAGQGRAVVSLWGRH